MTEENENENIGKLKDIVKTREFKEKSKDRLLTLKDLQELPLETSMTAYERVRQEAIKWIKQIQPNCPRECEHYLGEVYGLITWIKHFFNITDKEIEDDTN